MKNFIITTDNTCDLDEKELKKLKLEIAHLPYFVNDEEFSEETGKSLGYEEFFDKMKKGFYTRTSLINEYNAEMFLEKQLKKGVDVLHLGISSGLSGTFASFQKAADKLNKVYDNKVYVVDTKSTSSGLGILIEMVANKAKNANTIKEIFDYAQTISGNIAHYFTVEDLKYLLRGGRISKASAIIGTFINIKPIIYCDQNGSLVSLSKVLSRKKSLLKLVEKFKEKYNQQFNKVYISHAQCHEDAEFIAAEIKKISNVEVVIEKINFVVGSHCGPGCIAIFFTTDQRKDKV